MRISKRLLILTFAFIILSTLFAHFEVCKKNRIIVKAADLTNNHVLLAKQTRFLSPEEHAEVKKRFDKYQSQVNARLAITNKAQDRRSIVYIIVYVFIMLLPPLFMRRLLIFKGPGCIQAIFGLFITGLYMLLAWFLSTFFISPFIFKALGI